MSSDIPIIDYSKVDHDKVRFRRCSVCGYYPVPLYDKSGKQIPYDDLVCPGCLRHPSLTPF